MSLVGAPMRAAMAAAALMVAASTALAQTAVVPYAGMLERNGAALQGPYDLKFEAFSQANGGTGLWNAEKPATNVTAGKFQVTLDIPVSVLANTAVYMEVSVKPAGGGTYTVLGRQQLRYAPYAARAEAFSVGSSVSFDERNGQKLNLWRTEYGLGIENNTLYYKSNGTHRWYLNGSSTPVEAMRLEVVTNGGPELRLTGQAPQIRFSDSNATSRNYWLHNNDGRLYVLLDDNGDGQWDAPYPLVIDGRTVSINGNVLRAQSFPTCSGTGNLNARCTATCPSGMVVRQAWGFHGYGPTEAGAGGWTCGGGVSWQGNCVGQNSCEVVTGCNKAGVQLVCEQP